MPVPARLPRRRLAGPRRPRAQRARAVRIPRLLGLLADRARGGCDAGARRRGRRCRSDRPVRAPPRCVSETVQT